MSGSFKTILCPVDVDEDCSEQMALALALAEQHQAAVCLLYVAAEPVAASDPVPEWQERLQYRLYRLGETWFEGKVPFEVAIWSGDPASAIIGAARASGADLIVIATRRRGLDRVLLGSVANRVVRESPVPVLTIRPKAS